MSTSMSPVAAPCNLVYLDIGTNDGTTISKFAHRKPEARLRETLRTAMGNTWQPNTTCVYGFEPNPMHTAKLKHMQLALIKSGLLASLQIYTESAMGGPEQLAAPMWLVSAGGKNKVGSHLTTSKPSDGQSARPVNTMSLADWLRRVCLPRHGKLPVVMRMDVEGTEYDILSDLATSGIGRAMNIYLNLEWHRGTKQHFLGPKELAHVRMLDDHFLRHPFRCGDGSCSSRETQNKKPIDATATLEGSLEKTLAFMLHRAGITYADALFDLNHTRSKAKGSGPSKIAVPQAWTATQERKQGFAAIDNSSWRGDWGWARRR